METVISVNQWDRRFFPVESDYRYSPFRIILERRVSENQGEYVAAGTNFNIQDFLTPQETWI